jgi:RNA polymerase sigma factor (sigma-70 family)
MAGRREPEQKFRIAARPRLTHRVDLMSELTSFHDLLRGLRSGDPGAAAELVRQHEQAIRRLIRFRLTDARLGAVVSSEDICQSVFLSFFVRMSAGQYDLDSPEQLAALLKSMARNKIASMNRAQRRQRRDRGRESPGLDPGALAGSDPSPSRVVAAQEIWQQVRSHLSPEELQLAELRSEGLAWEDIAARQAGNAVALRKKLSRALARVAGQLGLEEFSDA